ncbi:hypothetical protein HK098_006745 [Nowakowskiella sp. JEL0407]|nr:hypothetical protein HK098_006745 [Nowakowskiella sp. JEL0407]
MDDEIGTFPPILKRHAACDTCYRQKLKCDGKTPCQRCNRLKRDCTYERAESSSHGNGKRAAQAKVKELEARVKELEAALARASISPQNSPEASTMLYPAQNSPAPTSSSSSATEPLTMRESLSFLGTLMQNQYPQLPLLNNNSFPVFSDFSDLNSASSSFPLLQKFVDKPILYAPIPTAPPQTLSHVNDVPFSEEIIDEMIDCFFLHCNFWPVNFMHPEWFFKNRHRISKPLLYIVCALGSRYSRYKPYLSSMGYEVNEVLFQKAKQYYDHEEISLENLMASIYMALYNVSVGRLRQVWIMLNLVISMVGFLKLHIDPDDVELELGTPIQHVEKETRRRLWWLVRGLVLKFPDLSRILETSINVRRPQPVTVFHAIPLSLQSPFTPMIELPEKDQFDAEPIGLELAVIGDSLRKFVEKMIVSEDLEAVANIFEANEVFENLKRWFLSAPPWFHSVLTATNISRFASKGKNQIPWLAIHLHLIYYAFSLHLYRFLFSRLCSTPLELAAHVSRPNCFYSALNVCWNAHLMIMNAFRTSPLLSNPELISEYPYALGPLMQSIVFSVTMMNFAQLPDQRNMARRDFHFTRQLITKNAIHWKVAKILLRDLDKVNELPAGPERARQTLILFAFGTKQYENMFLKRFESLERRVANRMEVIDPSESDNVPSSAIEAMGFSSGTGEFNNEQFNGFAYDPYDRSKVELPIMRNL